jgi:hypothetical protein
MRNGFYGYNGRMKENGTASRILTSTAVALAIALIYGGASVGTVEVWKIILALAGLFIFRAARTDSPP